MRFVKLQVALLLVAVLVVAALGADVVLKGRAESRLAAEVMAQSPDTRGVRARIRSFPFLARLLTSGRVAQVDITAQHAEPGGVALSDVFVELDEVELELDQARKGRAAVRSIKQGRVRADLGQDQINSRLPKQFQVQLEQGRAVISGPGGTEGKLTISPEGKIQLRIGSRSLLDLPVPDSALLPCRPSATFVPGALRLSCEFTEVPPLLLDLARA